MKGLVDRALDWESGDLHSVPDFTSDLLCDPGKVIATLSASVSLLSFVLSNCIGSFLGWHSLYCVFAQCPAQRVLISVGGRYLYVPGGPDSPLILHQCNPGGATLV